MSAGSLTLGGNMSIAVGPLGRNGEATGAINSSGKVAAMYESIIVRTMPAWANSPFNPGTATQRPEGCSAASLSKAR